MQQNSGTNIWIKFTPNEMVTHYCSVANINNYLQKNEHNENQFHLYKIYDQTTIIKKKKSLSTVIAWLGAFSGIRIDSLTYFLYACISSNIFIK